MNQQTNDTPRDPVEAIQQYLRRMQEAVRAACAGMPDAVRTPDEMMDELCEATARGMIAIIRRPEHLDYPAYYETLPAETRFGLLLIAEAWKGQPWAVAAG